MIETSRLEAQDGGSAAIPVTGDVAMAGGTLATADAETGEVWAVRYDDELGKPVVSAVDRQSEPLAEAGEGAALTVSQGGTVVVTSTEEGTVTTLAPTAAGFGKPRTRDLPGDAGQVTDVTTVGDRIVTLDADAGVLSVVGGATASVTPGSVLQQPGPGYDAVLVGAPDGLLSVDLDVRRRHHRVSTAPAPPRSSRSASEPCVYGAWSGGLGAVAVQCGSQEVMEDDLGGNATSLAFRVNRGEIVLNDANSGTVWDVQQDKPIRIDNWEAFTSKKKNKDDDEENENQTEADRRPPQAKPDSYGVRAGRTTVLHPLDNDSAPDGRLLSIVDVDQPSGGARVEISPDGQTLVLEMPEDARARPVRLLHRRRAQRPLGPRGRRRRRCAAPSRTSRPRCGRARRSRPTRCRTAASSPSRCWRTGATTATATPCSSTRPRPSAGSETGRRRPHHGRRPDPLHRPDRSRRRPAAGARGVRRDRRSLRPGHEVDELPGPGAQGPEGLRAAGRARRRTRRGRQADQDPAAAQRPARLRPQRHRRRAVAGRQGAPAAQRQGGHRPRRRAS